MNASCCFIHVLRNHSRNEAHLAIHLPSMLFFFFICTNSPYLKADFLELTLCYKFPEGRIQAGTIKHLLVDSFSLNLVVVLRDSSEAKAFPFHRLQEGEKDFKKKSQSFS